MTCQTYDYALHNDHSVRVMLEQGATFEQIIGQLAAEKEGYLNRIIELESLAPRKIVGLGGKVMVWHCPDDLIPVTMLLES